MSIPDRIDHDSDGLAVVLVGAGGHARAVAHVLSDLRVRVAAIVDPQAEQAQGWADDVVRLSGDDVGDAYAHDRGLPAVLAVGANHLRGRLAVRLLEQGIALPPVVAASATVACDAEVSDGAVVLHHAHVGPLAAIGTAVVVNTGADVEHDCIVGDAAHVAPHAVLGGAARCGVYTLLGTSAVLLPQVAVGDRAVVGAGAVVIDDLPDDVTAVGVPAHVMVKCEEETADA